MVVSGRTTVLRYFLSPFPDKGYFQLCINAEGTILDVSKPGGKGWSSRAFAVAKILDKKWMLELSIPFSSMGIKGAPPVEWRANFNRTRYAGKSEDLAWAPTGTGSSHVPHKFGYLSFAAKNPKPEKVIAKADKAAITVQELGNRGIILTFDLKSLAGKKIYNVRLKCEREKLTGEDSDIQKTIEIYPIKSIKGSGSESIPEYTRTPLKLIAPWYNAFDMTKLVQGWVSDDSAVKGVYVKVFPAWKAECTFLEVTYEGSLKKEMVIVSGLKTFHRSGQTFITWQEIENIVTEEKIPWGKLKRILNTMDEKREVRYSIYQHTKPITSSNLQAAKKIAEVKPLSALDINARCIEYGIDKQIAGSEHIITGQEDPFGGHRVTREKGIGLNYLVGRYVISDDGKPLSPGTGLFVQTAEKAGKHYYAVAVAINGVETSAGIVGTEPVEEKPSEPQPVLQGKLPKSPFWGYKAVRYHFVQWCAPPKYANLPNQAYSYGVSVPDNPPKDGLMPMEIFFHPRRFSYYRPVMRVRNDSLVICPYDFPMISAWYGYHEALGTLKSFKQGVVHNYTDARIVSFVKWAQKKWKVDKNRISTVGALAEGASREDAAGTAALWFGLEHRKFVNAIMASQPSIVPMMMSEKSGPHYRRRPSKRYFERVAAWGQQNWKTKTDKGKVAWEVMDCMALVQKLKPAEETPFIAIGGTDGQIISFMQLLQKLRRPSWNKAHYGTISFAMIDGSVKCSSQRTFGLRLNRSLPSMNNCSTDSIKPPDMLFGTRMEWDGDKIVDEPSKYEVILRDISRRGKVTFDLTLRQLQKFVVKPGKSFSWKLVDVGSGKEMQKGKTTADSDGLLTIPRLTVTLKPAKLTIQPAK